MIFSKLSFFVFFFWCALYKLSLHYTTFHCLHILIIFPRLRPSASRQDGPIQTVTLLYIICTVTCCFGVVLGKKYIRTHTQNCRKHFSTAYFFLFGSINTALFQACNSSFCRAVQLNQTHRRQVISFKVSEVGPASADSGLRLKCRDSQL